MLKYQLNDLINYYHQVLNIDNQYHLPCAANYFHILNYDIYFVLDAAGLYVIIRTSLNGPPKGLIKSGPISEVVP